MQKLPSDTGAQCGRDLQRDVGWASGCDDRTKATTERCQTVKKKERKKPGSGSGWVSFSGSVRVIHLVYMVDSSCPV